jgi:hypothetical protein
MSPEEWDSWKTMSRAMAILGFIVSLAVLPYVFLAYKDPDNLDHGWLLFQLAIYGMLATVASVAVNAPDKLEDRFCYDNAINYSQEDGPSSACTAQAGILVFCFLAALMLTFFLAVEAFLKYNEFLDMLKDKRFILGESLVTLVFPLIIVNAAAAKNMLGFPKNQSMCFMLVYPVLDEKTEDFPYVFYPVLVIDSIAVAIAVFVFCQKTLHRHRHEKRLEATRSASMSGEALAVSKSDPDAAAADGDEDRYMSASGKNLSSKEGLHLDITAFNPIKVPFSITVVSFMQLVWIPYLVFKVQTREQVDDDYDSVFDWVQCIYLNWNGDNSAWEKACGKHFDGRTTPNLNAAVTCATTAWIIVLGFAIVYQRASKMLLGNAATATPVGGGSSSGGAGEDNGDAQFKQPAAPVGDEPGYEMVGTSGDSSNPVAAQETENGATAPGKENQEAAVPGE